MTFLGLYSVYLMKYAEKHFLEQSGRFGYVVPKTPTPAQNAHPETKQPGGPYRDMGGHFGNTCFVHAKLEGAL